MRRVGRRQNVAAAGAHDLGAAIVDVGGGVVAESGVTVNLVVLMRVIAVKMRTPATLTS
jgi:hypothetical protein